MCWNILKGSKLLSGYSQGEWLHILEFAEKISPLSGTLQ